MPYRLHVRGAAVGGEGSGVAFLLSPCRLALHPPGECMFVKKSISSYAHLVNRAVVVPKLSALTDHLTRSLAELAVATTRRHGHGLRRFAKRSLANSLIWMPVPDMTLGNTRKPTVAALGGILVASTTPSSTQARCARHGVLWTRACQPLISASCRSATARRRCRCSALW